MKHKEIIIMSILLYLAVFTPLNTGLTDEEIRYFHPHHHQYRWLTWEIYSIVKSECYWQKVDYRIILALIDAESNGYKMATSKSGAVGLMQVMQFHYRSNRPERLYEPRRNVHIGCRIFKRYLRRARGNIVYALRNYERGPGGKGFNGRYIAKIVQNYYGRL